MRYLSLCSGIEAASVAWHHLGWTPVAFSEIEPFPSAVLAHRFPNVPNLGDMTRHAEWPLGPGSIDLLVGGTPCQSFSVAGLRKGLSDPRGGLMLTYLEIAQRLRPRWIVWENVPGVLSSGSGRDLGAFLGALGELGYGWAYRVLDAQWVRTQRHPRAVPQRRRRIFVVGCLGDPTAAAQVLFERESVQRDSAKGAKARKAAPADAEAGARAGCYKDGSDIANTLTRKGCDDRMPDKDRLFAVLQPVASTLGNRGLRSHTELDGHGAYIPVPIQDGREMQKAQNGIGIGQQGDPAYTLDTTGAQAVAHPVAFQQNTRDEVRMINGDGRIAGALAAESGMKQQNYIAQPVAFRKSRRAQSVNDHETLVAAEQANTLNQFDTGERDTHAVAYGMTTSVTPKFAREVQPTLTVPSPTGGGQPPALAHTVAFTPGNLSRGAGPSPNAEVAPTQRCRAGDQRTCVAFSSNMSEPDCQTDGTTPTVKVGSGLSIPSRPAVATSFIPGNSAASRSIGETAECCVTVKVDGGGSKPHVQYSMTVRRLTPRECERLQGFPDDWTMIPWRGKPAEECPDGPRYKALGNSMACNCMAWIGERINSINTKETP